jgi:hypothetical protein
VSKSPIDLEEFMKEHVKYEIDMLRCARWCLASRNWDCTLPSDWTIRNALIESYWVHARNLLDFFRDGKHSSKATQFCVSYGKLDFKKSIKLGSKTTKAGDLYKNICDQITHLGESRTADVSEKLDVMDQAIYDFVEMEINRFRDHLKDVYKGLIPTWAGPPKTIGVSGPPAASSTALPFVGATGPAFYPAAKKPEG